MSGVKFTRFFCGMGLMWLAICRAAFSDVPHILTEGSTVEAGWGGGLSVSLALSDRVPYRVFTLSEPDRLVVDVKAQARAGFAEAAFDVAGLTGGRFGIFAPGWSRLVLDLSEPVRLTQAAFDGDHIALAFEPTDREQFEALSGAPPGLAWQVEGETSLAPPKDGRLRVAIDPGHGGVDPGAVRDGVAEKDIALSFARDLAEAIRADGAFDAALVRERDEFVSLDDRIVRARGMEADIFLSIHANTVTEGDASGAAVYSLSDRASDRASAALAEMENRADLAAGLDVRTELDEVARALVDLARTETNARSRGMADALVGSLSQDVGVLRTRPHRSAGFRVLKAPDMPSVLLELGFLSNDQDRANMQRAKWRQTAAEAVLSGLKDWAKTDRARADLVLR